MKKLLLILAVICFSCDKNDDSTPSVQPKYEVTISSSCPQPNQAMWQHYCITKETRDAIQSQMTTGCNVINFTTKDGSNESGYVISVGSDSSGVCD